MKRLITSGIALSMSFALNCASASVITVANHVGDESPQATASGFNWSDPYTSAIQRTNSLGGGRTGPATVDGTPSHFVLGNTVFWRAMYRDGGIGSWLDTSSWHASFTMKGMTNDDNAGIGFYDGAVQITSRYAVSGAVGFEDLFTFGAFENALGQQVVDINDTRFTLSDDFHKYDLFYDPARQSGTRGTAGYMSGVNFYIDDVLMLENVIPGATNNLGNTVSMGDIVNANFNGGAYFAESLFEYDPTATAFAEPSVIPVPAAVWLFASGFLGLVGVARRD